ncbi:MAG: YjgN family protein [Gammaproteobacteria bacterium]|nr:YjgN family protein [Gammaproteobacteria bacterium]
MIKDKMLKPVELEFNGKAGEYFRIWIVNVLLSIVTLGIYSAWAKVRNKQYFYGNTILDGSPFEYGASPIAILKGRIVVVAVLAAVSILSQIFPLANAIFFIVFFIVLPWLVMRSLMFNARYSSYRNLNFSFEKNLSGAVKTFIGIGLLVIVTLGLAYPFYTHAIQKYRVDNHGYGQYVFHFKKSAKAFYKYYFIGLVIVLATLILVSLLFGGAMSSFVGSFNSDPESIPSINPLTTITLLLMSMIYLIGYFAAYAYVQTRVFNTVWSNTSLNKASAHLLTVPTVPLMAFKGTLKTNKMLYIYLTNTLGIIISFGLLIPWAKIRLARYRINNIEVSSIADLKIIIATQREKVGTIGSEMGDLLDIDIAM